MPESPHIPTEYVADPYGNGTLVPSDHWGAGCPEGCDVHIQSEIFPKATAPAETEGRCPTCTNPILIGQVVHHFSGNVRIHQKCPK